MSCSLAALGEGSTYYKCMHKNVLSLFQVEHLVFHIHWQAPSSQGARSACPLHAAGQQRRLPNEPLTARPPSSAAKLSGSRCEVQRTVCTLLNSKIKYEEAQNKQTNRRTSRCAAALLRASQPPPRWHCDGRCAYRRPPLPRPPFNPIAAASSSGVGNSLKVPTSGNRPCVSTNISRDPLGPTTSSRWAAGSPNMASPLARVAQPWAAGSRVSSQVWPHAVQGGAAGSGRDLESFLTPLAPGFCAQAGASRRARPAQVVLAAAGQQQQPPPANNGGATTQATAAAAAAAQPLNNANLATELQRLKEENEALRLTLASYQQCDPEEVTVAPEGAAGGSSSSSSSSSAAPVVFASAAALESGIRWPTPGEDAFWERPPREAPLPLGPLAPAPGGGKRDGRGFHVIHITAEMAPCAKVGGLGDVVTGLARACLGRGHNVEIMLPVSCWHWVGWGGVLAGCMAAGCGLGTLLWVLALLRLQLCPAALHARTTACMQLAASPHYTPPAPPLPSTPAPTCVHAHLPACLPSVLRVPVGGCD